jgi:hypothetical protein
LVDEFYAGEVFESLDRADGGGIAVGVESEMAGDVLIDDVVGEGGFAGAGDAGEADEAVEGSVDVEFADVVAGAPVIVSSFLVGGGVWRGWGWICGRRARGECRVSSDQ